MSFSGRHLAHPFPGSDSAPLAAIVIVTHNRADGLRVLLDDIAASMLSPALQEIVVVENGNRDSGSAHVCAAWKSPLRLIYAFQDDPRKTTALNFAISITTAPFIIFFDDDVRLDAGTVESYVAAATRHGPQHHFGGRTLPQIEEKPPDWLEPFLPDSARGFDLGDRDRDFDKPLFIGSNWAAFRADLLAAGGFPHYLGPGTPYRVAGDETIMQARLQKQGSKGVYLATAVARHHVPRGSNDFAFACDRSRSYGLRLALSEFVENGRAAPYWPPRWLIRELVERWVRCAAARLLRKDIHARVAREIELAKTKGSLAAFRVLRKYPEIVEHRPIFRRIGVDTV